MKGIYFLIAFVFCCVVAVLAFINFSNVITIESNFVNLKVNVGVLILFSVMLGSLSTIFVGMFLGWSADKGSSRELLKHVENEKLKNEIESDKVKQLEAKIKTLEEALKSITK